jgi:predicted helicase
MRRFYPTGASDNATIFFSDRGARAPFSVLVTNVPAELHLCASTDGFQAVARFQFSNDGTRIDSLSDVALRNFQSHYGSRRTDRGSQITKDAIFHYVYSVLHDPIYREKYALNLKREFPRIPFYPRFWRWAEWGETLMKLHIGYEAVEPWPLERIDTPDVKSGKGGLPPKAMLRANKDSGNIQLDSETQLAGVPPEAWAYRLGNRSALEWILDQHKEKTPKDPTIREKFNTYRFADHKEKVIDLLKRVTRVSVETTKIVVAMRAEKR